MSRYFTRAPGLAWTIRITGISLLVFFTLVGLGQAAKAHDTIVSSDPAPNSQLNTAPEKLSFNFSANPLNVGHEVVIIDTTGTNWATGDSTIEGVSVQQTVKPGMPSGQYAARWRVVSSDGHPIQGQVRFAIGEAVTEDNMLSIGNSNTQDTPQSTPQAQESTQQSGGSLPAWVLWALIGAGGALLGYLIWLGIQNNRSQKNDSQPSPSTKENHES